MEASGIRPPATRGSESRRSLVVRSWELRMNGITFARVVMALCAVLAGSAPAFAQIDISGSYSNLMHEDYIERGS